MPSDNFSFKHPPDMVHEKLVTMHGSCAIFGTVDPDGTIVSPYSVFVDGTRIKSGLASLYEATVWIDEYQDDVPTDFDRPGSF